MKKSVVFNRVVLHCFFFFLLGCEMAGGSEFYAILVGDTSEKTIKNLVKSDIKRMKKELRQIVTYTGQNLYLAVLQGDHLNLENLQGVFETLKPRSDDTVLFYQSSHGFRTSEHEGKWPILFFSAHNLGIHFESINQLLLNKKPRLLISLVNACNSPLPETFIHREPSISLVNRAKSNRNEFKEVYSKLFVESKGAIIASSSKSGQQSFGLDAEGSFFTSAFLSALKRALLGEIKADWNGIMKDTVMQTVKRLKIYHYTQRPQFMILDDFQTDFETDLQPK